MMKLSSARTTRIARLVIAGTVLVASTAMISEPAIAGSAPETAAVSAKSGGKWVVMAGTSLKSTLEGWCRVSNWTLIWDSPVDYRMRASATFSGVFEEAGAELIDSISLGNPELSATFYRQNRVLHIDNKPLSSN